MAKCFHLNLEYIKKLCKEEWEKGGHKGGAFCGNVLVDQKGHILYDLMYERKTLAGWVIAKIKGVWKLVSASEADSAKWAAAKEAVLGMAR